MNQPARHPSAIIDPSAVIGDGSSIGAHVIIGPAVTIGPGSVVEPFCMLGTQTDAPLNVGGGALIRSHSVIYSGSTIGPRLETGHHTTLREGHTIGTNLRVGSYSDLQGTTTIGDHVRIHSGVFVPQHTFIGDFVWLFPHVVLTNDPHPPSDVHTAGPTIGDRAVIGARAVVLPGIAIGADAFVAAGATVTREVLAGRAVVGTPARDIGPTSTIRWADREREGSPYPWWRHFSRGYSDVVFDDDGPRSAP